MKQVPVLFSTKNTYVFQDVDGVLTHFMCKKLNMPIQNTNIHKVMGIVVCNQLVGMVMYADYRKNHDIWMSIYTLSPRWAQRGVIQFLLSYPFDVLKCTRISALTEKANLKSKNMLERLGFHQEGLLRHFDPETKNDCYIYSLLPDELTVK